MGGGCGCGCGFLGTWCWQQLALQQREIHQLREQLNHVRLHNRSPSFVAMSQSWTNEPDSMGLELGTILVLRLKKSQKSPVRLLIRLACKQRGGVCFRCGCVPIAINGGYLMIVINIYKNIYIKRTLNFNVFTNMSCIYGFGVFCRLLSEWLAFCIVCECCSTFPMQEKSQWEGMCVKPLYFVSNLSVILFLVIRLTRFPINLC